MHKLYSRLALVAILLAAAVTATASAQTDNGGTAAEKPPTVGPSGGVAGPAVRDGAQSSQLPGFQEEPPQVEPPPEQEPAPPADEVEEPAPPADEAPAIPDVESPAGTTAAPSGGGGALPTTGLELAGLAAIGAGLLLAGLALRRRPIRS